MQTKKVRPAKVKKNFPCRIWIAHIFGINAGWFPLRNPLLNYLISGSIQDCYYKDCPSVKEASAAVPAVVP